jgi:hypothetical protein
MDNRKLEEPKAKKQYAPTPKGFMIPKSLGNNVKEVPLEAFNMETGENLISFGTGG